MTAEEIQAARDLAHALHLVLQGLGMAPTIHGQIIALCDEVVLLQAAKEVSDRIGDEWMAQYHGSIDRARMAEQQCEELDGMLCNHRGPCSNRSPSDDPHTIGALCIRFLGHPPPCRWSRP